MSLCNITVKGIFGETLTRNTIIMHVRYNNTCKHIESQTQTPKQSIKALTIFTTNIMSGCCQNQDTYNMMNGHDVI